MDFIGFISALYNDWIARMSGIGSILFTILGFIRHKKFDFFKSIGKQRKIFWSMALFCFFIASVSIWTNEHKKRIDLEGQLKEQQINKEPKLNCRIILITRGAVGERNESSVVLIEALIINTGAPSIVTDFNLMVKMGDKTIEGEPFLQSKKGIVFKGEPELKFTSDNYLPRKCLVPITTNGSISGYFIVFLHNISATQISHKNDCHILFSFKDVLGKSYSYNYAMPEPSEKNKIIDLPKMLRK